VIVANTINLGADLGAMGAAVKLLVGGPSLLYVAAFGLGTVLLEVFMRSSRYVSVLKWLSLSLLAYVATAFIVDLPWGQVALGVFVPHLTWSRDYLVTIVALLGTTISPYLFFWQAECEVEDTEEAPESEPLKQAPEQAPKEIQRMEVDTYLGMGVSNIVALFIVVTTAATLHAHGVTNIQTSADAAKALERWRASSPSSSSPRGSSAPACWPCRCWPARPPMPWERRWAGPWAWRASGIRPGPSTARSRSRPSSARS
jgi:Mn2+/Fe2+ NRAMP family transporter